jgi:superfamily I DNA/RNA helicase/hemerythrin-like domain-containing protein
MQFTASQRKAIEHGGRNLQLIACAGSGKTEVVARRVVHLLTPGRSDSLVPANIVAFTFTEKAAAELKERIHRRTKETLGDVNGMAEMFVGTIHAFCLELLKGEVPKYLKFEVLNEVQQALFVDRHSKQTGLTTSTTLTGDKLKRYVDTNRYIGALAVLRESDIDEKKLNGCSIVHGLGSYEQVLDESSYLDYSSILAAAVERLTNDDDLRARLAERIKYVIVDEYQDVNPIQEAVAWSLHELGARVCVVGDDDQTIYQWRGSDVENILTFDKRYRDVEQIPLEENFRSSEGIVETARAFIEQNSARLTKAMKPTGAQAHEPGDIVALSFADPEEEAQYIASTAAALHGVAFTEDGTARGLSWSDMTVLLRSVKSNAEPITAALRAADIPFVVTGMTNLFGTSEAEAARQLFYFLGDRASVDEKVVEQAWKDAHLGLDRRALGDAIAHAVAAKAALTDPNQKRWGQYSIQRVFLEFLEKAGVREESVPNDRGEVVFYNLGKFSQLISDFEAIHFHSKPAEKYGSFADFLEHRAEDAYPEGWQDNQYANPDAVRIMTIHQAKGMQWPVVFVPALLKNRLPRSARWLYPAGIAPNAPPPCSAGPPPSSNAVTDAAAVRNDGAPLLRSSARTSSIRSTLRCSSQRHHSRTCCALVRTRHPSAHVSCVVAPTIRGMIRSSAKRAWHRSAIIHAAPVRPRPTATSARKNSSMRPTDILSAEHRVIEQVLDCLERMSKSCSTSGIIDLDSGRTALRILRTFADHCHHGKEEQHLFPMLQSRGLPTHVGPVAVMLEEHELGRGEIRKMDAALAGAERGEREAARQFAVAAQTYVELLRDHIAKEDNILFPMAESVLRHEDRTQLLAAFQTVEHDDLRQGTHEEMLALANGLADKFHVVHVSERSPSVLTGCCHGHGRAATEGACSSH